MAIGKTDSRRRPIISVSVSSALLELVVFILFSAATATIYAANLTSRQKLERQISHRLRDSGPIP